MTDEHLSPAKPPAEDTPEPLVAFSAYTPVAPEKPPPPRGLIRLLGLLEIFLVSGLLTDSLAVALITGLTGEDAKAIMKSAESLFLYLMLSTILILLVVVILQHLHRREPELTLRFMPRQRLYSNTLFALLAVPVFIVFMLGAGSFFNVVFPGSVPERNPLLELIRTPDHLLLFMISSIFAGGFREEVQRAFVINRTAVFFWSPYLGLVAWSLFFGLQHYTQGLAAIFITAVLGLGFGLMYIWRKNIYLPFFTHACFNGAVLIFYWVGRPLT
ncbi:MAG: CPBP family intramembrane metalloprotease [Acidobacteria bacterium]|nr:CPBP family intramembrane metalloprotease [Acidobacteriota bacterium]